MKTIYKYELAFEATQTIKMTEGAHILTVQVQFDKINIWAIVNPSNKEVFRTFRILLTGEPIPENEPLKYLTTVQINNGAYINHVFEVVNSLI